jgi:hypothetical protein
MKKIEIFLLLLQIEVSEAITAARETVLKEPADE